MYKRNKRAESRETERETNNQRENDGPIRPIRYLHFVAFSLNKSRP